MSAILFEIALLLVLTIVNGIFSGSEIAVVSARKVRLEQLMRRGNKRATVAFRLASSPNDFLSTVQIGITLIGIVSGAIGGATLAERLAAFLKTLPFVSAYSAPLSFGMVVTFITYLSLVIGELLPKRLALLNPEQIACNMAIPMASLARFTAPLVRLLSASTDALLHILGIQASTGNQVTEEEIHVLLEQGTREGLFDAAEQEMVARVFRLDDRPIKAIMTPRTSIVWLDINADHLENEREIRESPYSRFPIGDGSLDNCLGIVRIKDFFTVTSLGQNVDLRTILRQPLIVPENTRILEVLETFRTSGTHLALITDEYGGIEGLVTLNDVIEAIVGELPSWEHEEKPQMVQREDGSWLVDGLLSIEKLKEILDRETLLDENAERFHTLAGFVLAYMEKIPTAGEYFDWEGFRFEVMDMDGTRVDKVLISFRDATVSPQQPTA